MQIPRFILGGTSDYFTGFGSSRFSLSSLCFFSSLLSTFRFRLLCDVVVFVGWCRFVSSVCFRCVVYGGSVCVSVCVCCRVVLWRAVQCHHVLCRAVCWWAAHAEDLDDSHCFIAFGL